MKDQVYSWRISARRKAELESEARREGTSLAQLLEQITADWLEAQRNSRNGDEKEQATIRRRIMATAGTIQGGRSNPLSTSGRACPGDYPEKARKGIECLPPR